MPTKQQRDMEARVQYLRQLRALRTPSVPSKQHTKKPTGNDWTLSSLKGVPGGKGGGGLINMINAARTGTRVIDESKLPTRKVPPTTSFSYERGGFQRVD
jgi:hypothetical protein